MGWGSRGGATPLSNALATAYARFDALGLQPSYHPWTNGGLTNCNLSAALPGGARSNERVLITAHLDDMPNSSFAPGADDNASGCAAVLTAAGVLSQYRFERTIRFVLFTGEEQGKFGSESYAFRAATGRDNIVAVVNLDTIATACPLSIAAITDTNLVFATRVQAGTRIRGEIEFTTQLPVTNWSALASFEFNAAPDQLSFETGWQPVEWPVALSALPPSPHYFFRLKRTWLAD